jgi:copper homeostasis protein
MSLIFELCAFNIQSAIIGEKAGAKRVELCDNPMEGGTTPSYGAIKQTREKISIDLYPIIRPRAGHYNYDADEWEIIRKDILLCKELGCNGISIGVQLDNGEIDVHRMKRIVEWAYPMGVTCNRVFDGVPDAFKSLEELIESGCERILTSGQKASAPEGADLIAKLILQADDRISIMPGAGVKSSTIEQLISATSAREYHGSARKKVENNSHQNAAVLDTGHIFIADEEEVRRIVQILQAIPAETA